MKSSEKKLGDFLLKKGNSNDSIKKRKSKGEAICLKLRQLSETFPLEVEELKLVLSSGNPGSLTFTSSKCDVLRH